MPSVSSNRLLRPNSCIGLFHNLDHTLQDQDALLYEIEDKLQQKLEEEALNLGTAEINDL